MVDPNARLADESSAANEPLATENLAWSIRRTKLSEEVGARLEMLMQDGTYPSGTMLPSERKLMQIFGVGRTSIREALYVLHRKGLVRQCNGERAVVTTPTPETLIAELSAAARAFLSRPGGLEQLQEARVMFESGVARIAAQRATDEDIMRLRRALEASYAARHDLDRFERTDVAFHVMLTNITRNPVFVAVHDGLVGWLTDQRTVSLRKAGALDAALQSHQRLFEAVASHNPAAAAVAMEEHLKTVADFVHGTSSGRRARHPR